MRVVRLAAVGAEGEVEEDIVFEARNGVGEGVFVVAAIASINCLREIDFV